MDNLSSSFLPKYSQYSNLSFVGINQKSPQTGIIAKYSLTTFHEPLNKLISRIKFKINETVNKSTRRPSLLTTVLKSVDDLICDSLDLPLSPSNDPKHILFGNFAPVDELPPTACEVVQGSLPSCLDGVYLRNGPNPQFVPRGPYHLFDGDGMLHMIKISNGKATYCSRFVKTYKYNLERDIGHPIIPSFLSSFNGVMASMARVVVSAARVLIGYFDPMINGFGTANTSVAVIGGKLYALGESDLPYEIHVTSDGDIVTLGRHDFHGAEEILSMTAHPKLDRNSGETFAFKYHAIPPCLTFFRIDSDGKKQPDVPIFSIKSAAVIHDFAVTKNYAIFNEGQVMISPSEILKGRRPVIVDEAKIPRLGIIERYAKDESEMWWIDVPGLNVSHAVNAWEEDDGETLVIVATNFMRVELIMERLDMGQPRLEEIRINVKENKVETRPLSTKLVDMAVINPAFAGNKNRYVYAPIVATPMMIVGILKVDLSLPSNIHHDYVVATRIYESGCIGGEPFFVAREPNNPTADEDDGFLVTYVYDERTQESEFFVMDAKSPTLEIIAVVKLPGRVPIGFHGLFLNESGLTRM